MEILNGLLTINDFVKELLNKGYIKAEEIGTIKYLISEGKSLKEIFEIVTT